MATLRMLRLKRIHVRLLCMAAMLFGILFFVHHIQFTLSTIDLKEEGSRYSLFFKSRKSLSAKPRCSDDDISSCRLEDIFLWNSSIKDDRIQKQLKFVPNFFKRRGENIFQKKIIFAQYGASHWGVEPGDRVFIEQQCPVSLCTIIDQSTYMRNMTIDAFALSHDFHPNEIRQFIHISKRSPQQIWMYFALESPIATPVYDDLAYRDVINWTATYRRDSTIVAPYYKWAPFKNASLIRRHKRNYAAGKKGRAAMFVSNCPTSNRRIEYARKLAEYFPVDIYGGCGDHTCSRFEEDTCFKKLQKEYKFYLSFENANCVDYITEKFFLNALSNDVVPIALGAHPDTYKDVAPPNSYIHVEDFRTLADLAEYLHILDKNDNMYNQYFEWKGTGDFINTKFWCRVCALLNEDNKPTIIQHDLDKWWRGEGTCRQWPYERWDRLKSEIEDKK